MVDVKKNSELMGNDSMPDSRIVKLYNTIHRPPKFDYSRESSLISNTSLSTVTNPSRPKTPYYETRESPIRRDTIVKYVYLSQSRPQPMDPLKAWKGYNGNLYFEPIRIVRYSEQHDQLIPSSLSESRHPLSPVTHHKAKIHHSLRSRSDESFLHRSTVILPDHRSAFSLSSSPLLPSTRAHTSQAPRSQHNIRGQTADVVGRSCGGQHMNLRSAVQRGSMAHQVAQRLKTNTEGSQPAWATKKPPPRQASCNVQDALISRAITHSSEPRVERKADGLECNRAKVKIETSVAHNIGWVGEEREEFPSETRTREGRIAVDDDTRESGVVRREPVDLSEELRL